MPLNFRALRLFAAAAEHGSLSKAAAAMFVTQPAVSKAIAGLERDFGIALLERGRRGTTLTEAGAVLYAQARVMLGAERVVEEEIALLLGLGGGSLRIGASTTIATYLLPPLLGAFHRQYPRIHLRVTSANTHDVAAALVDGDVDVALVEGPVHDERISVREWRQDELVVIAGSRHPLAGCAAVSLEQLAGELFVVREPGSGTREVAESALREHRLVPRGTLEVGSTAAIMQTVAAGLGVAIVSAAAAADQITLGTLRVLPVTAMVIRRSFTELGIPGRRLSPAAAAFSALLRPGDPRQGDPRRSASSAGSSSSVP